MSGKLCHNYLSGRIFVYSYIFYWKRWFLCLTRWIRCWNAQLSWHIYCSVCLVLSANELHTCGTVLFYGLLCTIVDYIFILIFRLSIDVSYCVSLLFNVFRNQYRNDGHLIKCTRHVSSFIMNYLEMKIHVLENSNILINPPGNYNFMPVQCYTEWKM